MLDPHLGASIPLAPPLFQTSVYRLPDLDTLDRISDAQERGFIYARDGHPNAQMLAEKIAGLERGKWAIVAGSGMGVLSAACLACVASGERIVASNRLYGRTTALLRQELPRFGVSCDFIDCSDLDAVDSALRSAARLLIVETISNPLLRLVDIPRLAEIAHRYQCRLLVDNTFATPALFRPLEHGADLAMESLTKMIGGHSDVTLGSLSGNDSDLHARLAQITSIWGFFAAPFDCWLADRSLSSFEIRARVATSNAAQLATWLAQQPAVKRVVYPTLPDHPDRALAAKLLPDGAGHMLCVELKGNGREAVNRFLRQARGIPFSPSLGHSTTTCSHPATTSHRFVSAEEKQRQGISDGLIRLSVGVEPFDDLKREMASGLEPLAA
jgi:cystathionine beta-lyase/cystathionine gamma-synthase